MKLLTLGIALECHLMCSEKPGKMGHCFSHLFKRAFTSDKNKGSYSVCHSMYAQEMLLRVLPMAVSDLVPSLCFIDNGNLGLIKVG